MKIDYDVNLYKKIARLTLNEIVQIRNRNGVKSTIHIQNITRLSWHELQLLSPEGANGFTKMALLYEKYVNPSNSENAPFRGDTLTLAESDEINECIKIYRENSFSKHFEIYSYISSHNLWDRFPKIRSLNTHGKNKDIPGVEPKYFGIICQLLNISGEDGLPLDSYKKY